VVLDPAESPGDPDGVLGPPDRRGSAARALAPHRGSVWPLRMVGVGSAQLWLRCARRSSVFRSTNTNTTRRCRRSRRSSRISTSNCAHPKSWIRMSARHPPPPHLPPALPPAHRHRDLESTYAARRAHTLANASCVPQVMHFAEALGRLETVCKSLHDSARHAVSMLPLMQVGSLSQPAVSAARSGPPRRRGSNAPV
jgi:hypothetical protein